MARKQGSGFKMKSSPAKQGILSDFFSNLGSQLKRNKKGVDEMYAEKRSRKPGESKYQADIRRRREARKARTTKSGHTGGDILTGNIKDTSDLTVEQRAKLGEKVYPQFKSNSQEITKPDWSKAPKVGTTARTNWYKKHNLKLDDTTPKHEETEQKSGYIQDDPEKENFGAMYLNPITKKSPYKKGLGKYTKKAKGSRGYKMKRK